MDIAVGMIGEAGIKGWKTERIEVVCDEGCGL